MNISNTMILGKVYPLVPVIPYIVGKYSLILWEIIPAKWGINSLR